MENIRIADGCGQEHACDPMTTILSPGVRCTGATQFAPGAIELGKCCACREASAEILVMLDRRGPISGHGWGCVLCGVPANGATIVLCSECFAAGRLAVEACRGWPGKEGRVPIGELVEPFDHDISKHPKFLL